MVNRFSLRTRHLLEDAQREAGLDAAEAVEPAHLLAALARERGTAAAGALDTMSVALPPRAEPRSSGGRPGAVAFTIRAKRVLARAAREARRSGAPEVDPEHVLVAMSREPGIDLDEAGVRAALAKAASGYP